ncbi:MAG: hypothetical protein DRQ44_03695 [Gammaproteobacteria bacterium]|nr:MAG: hypothetical protein DRQ44_03695 [Gammaproteobacteria bacterium]
MVIPAIIFPIILFLLPLACLAGDSYSLTRSIDPIEISGSEVPDMTGMEISNLRVFMSRNGHVRPIPFQIDQKGSGNDWIWDAIYDSDKVDDSFYEEELEQIVAQGNLTYDDQDPSGKSVFDNNDVVVFLAKDAGDKDRKSVMRLGADKLLELKITDPVNQAKGWVYLAYFGSDAPAISDIRYVQYEPEKSRVSGPEHEFLYSPEQTMILDDFKLGGVSVLAGNRIRGEVTTGIGPITLDFKFSEKDIRGYNSGYINGPVRIVKRSVEYVGLGSGITSPNVNCDHFHYPWHAEIPVLISKRFPVQRVSILATSIFREVKFSRAEVNGVEKPIFLGDHSIQGNILKENIEAEWIELAGEGISVINSVKIPQHHKGHLDVTPYLINAKQVSGVEVGFLIRTTDKTPDGDHVIHSVFLFTAKSNKEKFLENAIELLQKKLLINMVMLVQ